MVYADEAGSLPAFPHLLSEHGLATLSLRRRPCSIETNRLVNCSY